MKKIKVKVFFTRRDSFFSNLIYLVYKIFKREHILYTHSGLIINNRCFETTLNKDSNFYNCNFKNCKYIIFESVHKFNEKHIDGIFNKYKNKKYDIIELLSVYFNKKIDGNNKFVCSTLTATILYELNLLNKHEYKKFSPIAPHKLYNKLILSNKFIEK